MTYFGQDRPWHHARDDTFSEGRPKKYDKIMHTPEVHSADSLQVIRAGIIPFIRPTQTRDGAMLLGIKEGQYTDFGGGCQVRKGETPFRCALREMREELGTTQGIDLDRISHIFISGKNKPHQSILFVEVDEFIIPAEIPEGELEGVKKISFTRFRNLKSSKLKESLKAIRYNLINVLKSEF